jgi:hypothetical protein
MGDMQEVEKLMPFQPNDWAIRTNGLPSPLTLNLAHANGLGSPFYFICRLKRYAD